MQADREPHNLPPLCRDVEHFVDPRQRAQRRRPQLRPRPSTARGRGCDDRERVAVRRPGGCVWAREEGANRGGDRPGVAQELDVSGVEPAKVSAWCGIPANRSCATSDRPVRGQLANGTLELVAFTCPAGFGLASFPDTLRFLSYSFT
jgi:hypothetical protein